MSEERENREDCEKINTFTANGNFVIEDIFTKPNDRTSKTIEDAMVLMFETFGRDPEKCSLKDPKEHILHPDSEAVNVRLAQLGIDRKFELIEGQYIPNRFDIGCKTE